MSPEKDLWAWLHVARIRQAQALLEQSDSAIEWIAGKVGFGSLTTFRDHFKRRLGTSPQAYRNAFRRKAPFH